MYKNHIKILRLYEIGSNFEINIYKYVWIKFELNHTILRYQWIKTMSSKLNLCNYLQSKT